MSQKGISSIVIILIIVGFLAVAGGVYYFAVQKPSQPEQPQPVLPTQSEEQHPSPVDETADWKTYRNEEYGFEIKYPENWYAKADTEPTLPTGEKSKKIKLGVIFENYPPEISNEDKVGKKDWRLIMFSVEETSITEWIDIFKESKIEEITIDSQKGYKGTNIAVIFFVVAKDKYMYALVALGPDTITEKIFNQILSTFKFIK